MPNAVIADSTPIIIPEVGLERAICRTLGVSRENLTKEIVASKLRVLEANSLDIRDLSGLEFARNLEILVLRDNLIDDLKPISELSKLRKLDLSGNNISKVGSLVPLSGSKMRMRVAELQLALEDYKYKSKQKTEVVLELAEVVERLKEGPWALRELNLSKNRLLGLSGIEHLSDLVFLNVSQNALMDLEGVGSLKNLVTFYAQENQLGRVETFVDKNKNKVFDPGEPIDDQSGNGKRDTDPLIELKSLPKLTNLYLHNNLVENLNSLEDLPKLETLFLSGNRIQDASNLSNFTSLLRLSLSDNKITRIQGLEKLPFIRQLYLVENRISDLRPLQKMGSLKELHLQRNQIVDAKPIGSLKNLEVLSISYNLLFEVDFIRSLRKLKRMSLSSNCLPTEDSEFANQINFLRSQGVLLSLAGQRKRILEAESLIEFLSGYPEANHRLGEYLAANGYAKFMDFIDDPTVNTEEKAYAFSTWENTLKRRKDLNELDFLGK